MLKQLVYCLSIMLLCCGMAACGAAAQRAQTEPSASKPVSSETQNTPASSSTASKKPNIDRSCKVDADCVVKDVGNCCGYYPACVNKSSTPDPHAVQESCRKSGRMSVCGFQEISSCSCVEGKCKAESTPLSITGLPVTETPLEIK